MHLKIYLPARFSWGWSGGPRFNTDIVDMVNGYEKRNGNWANGRHAFKLGFKHLSPELFAELKGFHGVVRGMLHTFLFQDGMDPEAVDEIFGHGDGSTVTFQLSKLASGDGLAYARKVYALYEPGEGGVAIPVTPTVTVGGVAETDFTVDRERGLITLGTAPADEAELRWSGRFSLWVRLDRDELDFAYDEPNGIYGTLGLVEDKAPAPVTP
jgi:uncharacterized protein (TIGR02217 family)